MAITRGSPKAPKTRLVLAQGSFAMGADEGESATHVQAIAAGTDVTITDDGVGVSTLTYESKADASAKALLDMATVTTNIDTVIEAATGGVAGNSWVITIMPGHAAAAGAAYEDTTNKIFTWMYLAGTSDVDDFETVITASASLAVETGGTGATVIQNADLSYDSPLAGGTAQEYATQVGNDIVLHYTDAVTEGGEAVTALNLVSGKTFTASGGSAHAMAAPGDTDAKTSLLTAVPKGYAAESASTKGPGYVCTKEGTGLYYITFVPVFTGCQMFHTDLGLNAAGDQFMIGYKWNQASNRIEARLFDYSDAAAADVASNANNRVNFMAIMEKAN